MYARDEQLGVAPVVAYSAIKIGAGILSGLLTKPSEDRAAAVMPYVIRSAVEEGNLSAVKVLDERRAIGISAERAVWTTGYNTVAQQAPTLLSDYQQYKAMVPEPDQRNPETAAQWALSHLVTVEMLKSQGSGGGGGTAGFSLGGLGLPLAAAGLALFFIPAKRGRRRR